MRDRCNAAIGLQSSAFVLPPKFSDILRKRFEAHAVVGKGSPKKIEGKWRRNDSHIFMKLPEEQLDHMTFGRMIQKAKGTWRQPSAIP